jgi:hypothetical protein
MASTAPKIFISYSHDFPEHPRRVLGLAKASARTASMLSSINPLPGHHRDQSLLSRYARII